MKAEVNYQKNITHFNRRYVTQSQIITYTSCITLNGNNKNYHTADAIKNSFNKSLFDIFIS